MKRSEVERVARKMGAIYAPDYGWEELESAHAQFLALARWHLREVRRARGLTVGYTVVARFRDHRGRLKDPVLSSLAPRPSRVLEVAMQDAEPDGRLARVVLVPKRGAR